MSDTPTPPLRVACVDDNELLASALERCFETDPRLAWAGWICGGSDVLERVRALAPDVVLVDIDLPGVDSFELVRQLEAVQPSVKAVMFSGHVQPRYVDMAVDAGAWGYLSKNEDTASIFECILRVGRGEIALSREVEEVRRRSAE